jgi:hypothetical protein
MSWVWALLKQVRKGLWPLSRISLARRTLLVESASVPALFEDLDGKVHDLVAVAVDELVKHVLRDVLDVVSHRDVLLDTHAGEQGVVVGEAVV